MRSSGAARFFRALSVALVCAFASAPAHAQSAADLREARAQFQRGIELEQAGNYSEAIQQFREVGQVRMTPQVRFHIAFCEESLGRLVTALGGYDLALAEADSVGPDFRNEVETAVARLRERIPKLVIERGGGAEAALVQLDGVDLGATSIGVEVPLDPGPHKVTAVAPGYTPFDATVELKEREVTRVVLELEVAPKDEVPPPPPKVIVVPPEPRPSRTVPYIVGGAGIAFLMGGGALFVLRQTTEADLERQCPDPDACPSRNEAAYDRLKFYNVAAPIAVGVGAAAVGTAALLIVFEKKPAKKPAKAKNGFLAVDALVPARYENGSYGVEVLGRF